MLKNYINIAYRNLLKRKAHSFITVFGLAIALTAFILIMLWVRGELAYDNYNLKDDRIYRINTIIKQESGNNLDMAMTALPLAAALQQLPEVENTARLQGPQKNVVVKVGDRIFNEDNFFFADPTVFKVFTIPLLDGNSETVLNYPNSIVLTETMAQKYFGSEEALGKTFSVNYDDQNHNYIITGIMRDLPAESHIHINFLVPLSAVGGDWDKVNCYTYVLMHKNISINKFENQLPEIIKQFMGNDAAVYWSMTAQKLNDIHLHSHRLLEIEPNGNPASIYIFSTAGILILLIAVINFISLATAKFADRTREIGVRKVLGAGRNQLIVQFIYENALIIFISLLFAVSITELLLPFFNNLVHRTVVFTFNSSFLIVAAGLLVISIAATYPAIIFSSMNPALVINKQTKLNPGGNSFRRILVIIQFSIAIALIMCSVIMKEQLNFLLNKNLGIDISNTLLVPLRHTELRDKYPVLKNKFLQLKEVKDISESSNNPANMNPITSLAYGGRTVLEVKSLAVDYNFLKTMGLRLLSGRDFSRQITGDSTQAIIINESAAEKLNAMHLMDKEFGLYRGDIKRSGVRVIGIINNYNYRSLRYTIEPVIFFVDPNAYRYMEIKISPNKLPGTLKLLKQKWAQTFPNYPFGFTFLDQSIMVEYESDIITGKIFDIFSLLSILIGCLGLLGLVSYSVEKRTKEIGIRKVLGSSVKEIVILLSKDLLMPVIISGFIAAPVSFYFIHNWLEQFAFKIKINPLDIIISACAVFLIAFLTIIFHSVKAANANPVHSLRYE